MSSPDSTRDDDRGSEPLSTFLASSLTPRRKLAREVVVVAPAPVVAPLILPRRRTVAPVTVETLPMQPRPIKQLAWGVSFVVHVVCVGVAGWLVARAASNEAKGEPQAPTIEATIPQTFADIELPTMTEVTSLTDARTKVVPIHPPAPHASGPDGAARPDTRRDGRGGSLEVQAPALNLADRDDAIALSKEEQSRTDRSQIQRLRVGDVRTSQDDRRATWEPMEVTFLASGKGTRQERREVAETDPSQGARQLLAPGTLGGSPGAAPLDQGDDQSPRDPGTTIEGGVVLSAGAGVQHGALSNDRRLSADVAFARPQVTEARPAVPSNVTGKPRDNAESDQEVSAQVRALLHASTAGGASLGSGPGGEKAKDPAAGSGGDSGPGSRAKALGQGGGSVVDPDGDDARLTAYRRGVTSRVASHLKPFPKEAALEGRGGRSIVRFTIARDGSVSAISTARPSGVDEFDEDLRQAVMHAGPFAPIPQNLAAPMTIFFTDDSLNAAVR